MRKRVYHRRAPESFTPEERFWFHVDKTPACWKWLAYLRNGYGRFAVDGKLVSAHRWMFERTVCEVPEGFDLDHLCRNRDCVRPDHLEIVTRRENARRGVGFPGTRSKQTQCINGHPYNEENTYWRKGGHTRDCRACRRMRWPKKSARRRTSKCTPTS